MSAPGNITLCYFVIPKPQAFESIFRGMGRDDSGYLLNLNAIFLLFVFGQVLVRNVLGGVIVLLWVSLHPFVVDMLRRNLHECVARVFLACLIFDADCV